MRLFDVHSHLQDSRLDLTREAVILRAKNSGVVKMLSCGVHEGDWDALSQISSRFDAVCPAYGLHPWFIDTRSESWIKRLEAIIATTGASIGEIGLDRMIQDRSDEDQKAVFIAQLRLARKYQVPVSVHCRKSWALMAEILEREGGFPFGGVIHAYSGSGEMVKVFEKLGAYISFSGSITKPDNKRVSEAVKQVSGDRLLIETDSPDILPHGAPRTLNEPAFIHFVLSAVAERRGERIEKIAEMTFENSMRIYGKFCCRKENSHEF
ncbi:MAG: TatD family hydrolase [Proteobacteria bacterium]|nr:TatD family hydrolase [Pseudomonadota bacterium]